jgi:hypothetical protein
MTDWWSDSAAWASAIGTIAATSTALVVALRAWRDTEAERKARDAERADRDAAQARLIVVSSPNGASIEVSNFSTAPILHVEVQHVWRMSSDATRPVEQYQARLRGGDSRKVWTVLAPQESKTVDIVSQDSNGIPRGNYALTIRFTDAAGLDWERTGNDPPRRLINGRWQIQQRGTETTPVEQEPDITETVW